MIDPFNITRTDLKKEELEEVLLFWVCASGKNAVTASNGLEKLMLQLHRANKLELYQPFEAIRKSGYKKLPEQMRKCGIGCYNHKAKTFWQLANCGFDLKTCSVEQLETIHGIGMKTSRCFIIHSRENPNCAGLDVHILRYLKDQGFDVPESTPPKKQYLNVEKLFLELVAKSGKSVAELDLDIWKEYRNKTKIGL